MVSRPSIVHIVDPNELAIAQAMYAPFAKQAKKSSQVNEPHVSELSSVLAATSEHNTVNELVYALEMEKVKKKAISANKLVSNFQGEFSAEIKKAVHQAKRAYQGDGPNGFYDVAQNVIESTVREGQIQKTKEAYFDLFKKNSETLEADLKAQGVSSPRLVNFLLSYLNKDFLCNVNTYHEKYCHEFLKKSCRAQDFYQLESDPKDPRVVFLRATRAYFSTEIDSKYFGTEVARTETVLRITESGNILVRVNKSETAIFNEDLREQYLLHRLKKQNGIVEKAERAHLLDANDNLVVRQFLHRRPWSDQLSRQIKILNETEDLDELFWRAQTEQSFFGQFFQLRRTKNQEEYHNHLFALQKFCQMPNLQLRLSALEKHHLVSRSDLVGAYATIQGLNYCIGLIQNQDWYKIAELLNHNGYRDLMMCAMHSLKDVKVIRKALSYSGILYALDANTLNYFSLKNEAIARLVLSQSLWRRVWVWLQDVFWGEIHWQLPVSRLQGHHVSRLWEKYFKPLGSVLRGLFKLLDMKRDIFKLSRAPSVELREATSKALFSDQDLTQRVLRNPVYTIEAANARLNLISDLNLGVSYEDQSLNFWPDYFQFGLAEPKGRAVGTYSVADNETVENHYYKFFLGLIEKSNLDKDTVNVDHKKLQNQIIRLWAGSVRLPERPGVEQIVKNAMMRVIRDKKVPLPLNGLPLSFYLELLKDPKILKNFIVDSELMNELRKPENKKLRKSLRIHLRELVQKQIQYSRQGLAKRDSFTLVHLEEVNQLFNVSNDEIYKYPEICREYIRQVLHHYTNTELMSGFPIDEVDIGKVRKLLEHAEPMDLLEILMHHSEVRKTLNIEGIENKIHAADEKLKKLRKRPVRNKAEIKSLEDEIAKLDESRIIPRNIDAFFTHAVNLIKENKEGFLDKIDPDYLMPTLLESPKSNEKLSDHYKRIKKDLVAGVQPQMEMTDLQDLLTKACTNTELRQIIWSNPALQKKLALSVDFTTIFSFFRATNFNRLNEEGKLLINSSSFLNWESAFLELLKPENDDLLSQHWVYFLENVPGFAAWAFYQLGQNPSLGLSGQRLKDLIRYKVVGSDLLIHLEREYANGHYVLRESLLDEPELLTRLLKNQRPSQNNKLLSNTIVKIICLEANIYRATRNQKSRKLIGVLFSENNLALIVSHADVEYLCLLLEHVKRPEPQQHTATDIRTQIILALIKDYLNREHRRGEIKTNPDLMKLMLSHSTDAELLVLTTEDPSLFEFMDRDLMSRYLELGSGAVEQLYVYLQTKFQTTTSSFLPRIADNLNGQIPLAVLSRLLPVLINQVWQLSEVLSEEDKHSDYDQRELVYNALKGTELSLKLNEMDSAALYHLFTQSKDLRAIELLFIKHPSLGSRLMLKSWLSNSASELCAMLTHQFESSVGGKYLAPQDIRKNFSREMVNVLVQNISTPATLDRFFVLAKDENFLKTLFQHMSLSQLKALVGADSRIADLVVDHFRKMEHRESFVNLLKSSSKQAAQYHLSELRSLFDKHSSILQLFIDCVKADKAKNLNTATFDSVVIDFVRSDQDHRTVFKILELCYKKNSGVFYENFTVPLNTSKTRIFLLYHICGGLELTQLYNRHIKDFRRVWRKIRTKFTDPSNMPLDYLRELEKSDKAGSYLSFAQLIRDDYRFSDGDLSRTESILYPLYSLLSVLKEHYKDFRSSHHKAAKHLNQSTPLFRLFEAIVNAESRCLQPVVQASSRFQLTALTRADKYLPSDCSPMTHYLPRADQKHLNKPTSVVTSNAFFAQDRNSDCKAAALKTKSNLFMENDSSELWLSKSFSRDPQSVF